jgi:hypothetical protein
MVAGRGGGDGVSSISEDDWRNFRAELVKKTSTKDVSKVAPDNVALLLSQNPELATEYMQGVWAHETGEAEVGGLLARMSMEYQIMHLMRLAHFPKGAPAQRGADAELAWGRALMARLKKEAGQGEGAEDRARDWMGRTSYLYKLSGEVVKEEIQDMIDSAGGMRINADKLSAEKRALLMMYIESMQSWQEVILVLEHDALFASGVTINRPLRRGMDRDLAQLLLQGIEPTESTKSDIWVGGERASQPIEMPFLLKFLQVLKCLTLGTKMTNSKLRYFGHFST